MMSFEVKGATGSFTSTPSCGINFRSTLLFDTIAVLPAFWMWFICLVVLESYAAVRTIPPGEEGI